MTWKRRENLLTTQKLVSGVRRKLWRKKTVLRITSKDQLAIDTRSLKNSFLSSAGLIAELKNKTSCNKPVYTYIVQSADANTWAQTYTTCIYASICVPTLVSALPFLQTPYDEKKE